MGANVLVFGVALKGRFVALLGLVELALAEINIGQLLVKMRLVEMVDIGLQLLDPAPVGRSGQLEAGHRIASPGRPVHEKEIKNVVKNREEEDEGGPKILPALERIDEHPDVESGDGNTDQAANPTEIAADKLIYKARHVVLQSSQTPLRTSTAISLGYFLAHPAEIRPN